MKTCALVSYLNFHYMHNKNAKALLEALFFSFIVQSCSLLYSLLSAVPGIELIAPRNEAYTKQTLQWEISSDSLDKN